MNRTEEIGNEENTRVSMGENRDPDDMRLITIGDAMKCVMGHQRQVSSLLSELREGIHFVVGKLHQFRNSDDIWEGLRQGNLKIFSNLLAETKDMTQVSRYVSDASKYIGADADEMSRLIRNISVEGEGVAASGGLSLRAIARLAGRAAGYIGILVAGYIETTRIAGGTPDPEVNPQALKELVDRLVQTKVSKDMRIKRCMVRRALSRSTTARVVKEHRRSRRWNRH